MRTQRRDAASRTSAYASPVPTCKNAEMSG